MAKQNIGSAIANHPIVQAATAQKPEQSTAVLLLLVILILVVARSTTVQNFFKAAGTNASTAVSNAAHGNASANVKTATTTLDWHLFLYWSGAALFVIILSGISPVLTNWILGLIIVEELVVHWSSYQKFLKLPTK